MQTSSGVESLMVPFKVFSQKKSDSVSVDVSVVLELSLQSRILVSLRAVHFFIAFGGWWDFGGILGGLLEGSGPLRIHNYPTEHAPRAPYYARYPAAGTKTLSTFENCAAKCSYR